MVNARMDWPRLAAGGALAFALAASCSPKSSVQSAEAQTTTQTATQTAAAKPAAQVAPATSAEPSHSGGQPGEAFILHFGKEFDDSAGHLSDYVQPEGWIANGFDPRNVSFAADGMELAIQKRRTRGKPYTGAEFQKDGVYGYGRYEVVMTCAKAVGLISSFFTYTGEPFGDPHDEVDFEFLGKETDKVSLSYFGNAVQYGPVVVDLGFDCSAAPHLYAFEWRPENVRWFIDGKLVLDSAGKTDVPPPRTASRVIANIWSGMGETEKWTGSSTYAKASARYRCMSYAPFGETDPRPGRQCSDPPAPPAPASSRP